MKDKKKKDKKVIEPTDVKAFEPKVKNRFIVDFPAEYDIPAWVIKSVSRVKMSRNTINLGDGRRLAGKLQWKPITLKLYDPITPSTSQKLYPLIKKWREQIIRNEDTGKVEPLFEFKMRMLGPVGDVVSEWRIGVNEVASIDFGKWDWENDKVVLITLKVKPLYCILEY